jgi:hypothetical protein
MVQKYFGNMACKRENFAYLTAILTKIRARNQGKTPNILVRKIRF